MCSRSEHETPSDTLHPGKRIEPGYKATSCLSRYSVVASFPGSCTYAREPGNEANSVGAASKLEYPTKTAVCRTQTGNKFNKFM